MGQRKCDSSSGAPATPPPTPAVTPPKPQEPLVPDPMPFLVQEADFMLERVSPDLVNEILLYVATKPMWLSLHYAMPTFGSLSATEITGSGYRRQALTMEVVGRMLANPTAVKFKGIDVPVTVVAAAVGTAEAGGRAWGIGRFNPPRQLIDTRALTVGVGEVTFRVA